MTLKIVNKEHFYGHIMQKIHQKLVPNPFLIVVNKSKQPLLSKNSSKNMIF